jgi:hypothetical protein
MSGDTLFARLPGYIRARDAEQGQALRTLLRVLESEFDTVHGDIAQLYDDWFIETCEEWAVPYLGDLLGARRLNSTGGPGFSLRAYVANTLSYRRAKGTAAVIEQLARDVTLWPARVVEFWRLLVQAQHMNHPRVGDPRGPSLTDPVLRPSFHTVDLRDADAARSTGTPFDIWGHTGEIRPISRGLGRYNIPNVGIFLWRLLSLPYGFTSDGPDGYMGGIQPCPVPAADGRFFLSPLGVDLPLFNRPPPETAISHLATEHELPAPLRRLPLAKELIQRRAGAADPAGWFGDVPVIRVRLDGAFVPPERIWCGNLGDHTEGGVITWRRPLAAGQAFLDPELGRLSLHPSNAGKPVEVAYAIGATMAIGGGPYDRTADAAGWLQDLQTAPDGSLAVPWQIGVTRRPQDVTDDPANGGPVVGSVSAAIERWNSAGNAAGARGIIVILDNGSYAETLNDPGHVIALAADARLAIAAGAWPAERQQDGTLRRTPGQVVASGNRPHVRSSLAVAAHGGNAGLVLDGLLVEGTLTVAPGDLATLTLQHSTLGAAAAGLGAGLLVQSAPGGDNARLALGLARSVCGPITLPAESGPITVTDSALGEDRTADGSSGTLSTTPVLTAPGADASLMRCTAFGQISVRTLAATDLLATGLVSALRRQAGCIRYSFVPNGSHTPRRFRCQPDMAIGAALAAKRQALGDPAAQLTPDEQAAVVALVVPSFTSSRFENPAFAQLAMGCPKGIAAGGEGGTEMGVLASLGAPLRLGNLQAALQEYLRVGLEAGFFLET